MSWSTIIDDLRIGQFYGSKKSSGGGIGIKSINSPFGPYSPQATSVQAMSPFAQKHVLHPS